MKKVFSILTILSVIVLSSCIKNELVTYKNTQIELDAAVWNANAAGLTYPVITRIPSVGIATSTAQASLTRSSGSVTLRVNLIGAQQATDLSFTYQVATESTAVAGTHFTTISGTGVIPANSSFATIPITILNPGATTTGPKILVVQLTDNGGLKASVNYAKVGLSIAQN